MEARAHISILCLLLASTVVLLPSVRASKWTYEDDDTGPHNWTAGYPQCGGMKQSPIDIDTATVEDSPLGSFTLVGFGANDIPEGAAMDVMNNGHSIVVELEGDYMVSGAGLGSTAYKAIQFHFHWGISSTRGSEHTIDGRKYAAEMHVVAYNTKYGEFYSSLDYDDGLTVLGFLIEVQPEDNPGFTPLIDAIKMLQFYHDEYELEPPLSFASIFPDDLSSFYRYSGSLTTPTCNEIVTWNVFKTPIRLSEAQLSALRNQNTNAQGAAQNITLADNFRPVQALNGRKVYMNSGEPNAAPGLYASTSLVTMVIIKLLSSVLME